jgi:hypothetical protein
MSHFTVLVIGKDIESQLAPFQENNMGDCPQEYLEFNDVTDEYRDDYERADEETKAKYPTFEKYVEEYAGYSAHEVDGETRYGYWENPNRKWDWYQVGGRWSGMLRLKPGAEGESGSRSWMNRDEPTDANYCDSALKKDIDFATMRDEAGNEAAARWDEAHAIIKGRTWLTWEQIRAQVTEVSDEQTIHDAWRAAYNEQQVLQELRKEFSNPFLNLDEYLTPREAFITAARNAAGVTFAVLKEGEWYERGEMGWWGVVSGDVGQDDWNAQFAKLIDELPDDTRLTVVDCHI